jgi:TatD DNase family protein
VIPHFALVDSHCHLDFPDFAPELDAVVARAKAAGVTRMITIGTRLQRFAGVRAVAERFDDVFCTVGTHPHNAGEEGENGVAPDVIARLAEHPKVVGIGEAGLDYFYDKSPREAQARGLRAHIAAARISGLPLVIHARAADEDMGNILEDEMGKGAFAAVLHCFSSGPELARRGLALGLYLSFSGILTFKTATELKEVAAAAPADRILVETDAPYLAPGKYRGKRCEPAHVVETAKVLAELRGVSLDAIAATTTANVHRLFARLPALEPAEAAA